MAAGGLVLCQGLMTLLFGISEALSTRPGREVMGISTALFFVLFGAVLGCCAWGLRRARSWARGPVLFAQLAFLLLAWSLRHTRLLPLGVVLGVSAVLVLAALLHPATLRALSPDPDRDRSS